MKENNYFSDLYALDVSAHLEKKGKFTYLSWTYAVAELGKIDPTASWNIVRFNGLPYLESSCGFFVEVEVTVNGVMKSQIHPVLDNNNRPIEKPNCFQINTSIQRCLVKAIALHGLGLYVYAGEDLPEAKEPTEEEKQAAINEQIKRYSLTITTAETLPALQTAWRSIPANFRNELEDVKDAMKAKLSPQQAAA